MTLSTPVWGDLEDVYEPREDSFLLLDALENDLDLINRYSPTIALEIGPGSGVIIAALSKFLGSSSSCIAVDINFKACLATHRTAELNSVMIEVINGDLAGSLRKDNLVDLLVFNPPYVVTSDEEISGTIQRSWAGGFDGRQVLNRLLPELPDLMSNHSLGYIVLIKENNPTEVQQILKKMGFRCSLVAERKIQGEHLYVIRFSRTIK